MRAVQAKAPTGKPGLFDEARLFALYPRVLFSDIGQRAEATSLGAEGSFRLPTPNVRCDLEPTLHWANVNQSQGSTYYVQAYAPFNELARPFSLRSSIAHENSEAGSVGLFVEFTAPELMGRFLSRLGSCRSAGCRRTARLSAGLARCPDPYP